MFKSLIIWLLNISVCMSRKVYVVGVGMTKFMRPSNDNPDYPQLGKIAINRALIDAQCHYSNVQAVIAGYVNGDSTCGQRAVYEVGMTGVPVYNVNNNCATSSSALHLGKNLVAGGVYDCVLCFGFQKMRTGSISNMFNDRADPLQKFIKRTLEIGGKTTRPKAYIPYFFQNAGEQHMRLYGSKPEHFAMISAKNHKHSVHNPYSQHRKARTTEQVMKSPKINDLLTLLQCCPTSDGASAAVICDEATMLKLKRENEAVEILAIELTTDTEKMFQNAREVVGYSMAKKCAQQAYQKAGVKPADISCVELHDCFSVNQLLTYQALGLCEEGKGHQFVMKGDNTYGGQCVVNPSGGLHAKGHPLGATGTAQLAELVWQLRGIAGKRQVPNCRYALQHNLGLGGACVVGIYKKYNEAKSGGTQDLKQLQALQARLKDHPLPKL